MEIPVSTNDLDEIVYNIARDLIEERAINGSIDGITDATTREVVDDVVFIIEKYMYYINELFETDKLHKSKKIFENQIDFE